MNNVKKRSRQKNNKQSKSTIVFFFIFVICLVLFVSYLFIITFHPVGLIEYVKSEIASSGYGSGYNIQVNDGKPIYSISDNDKYIVVSSSSVNCYNRNGKTLFEEKHSLSEPVVKLSETRYLLYGQGERTLTVNTFSKSLYTLNFPSGIITAALSDSGAFAVASKVDGYSSGVSVFNKNNEKIYEWLSPDETVNSLALSSNGKSVAISTLKVVDGKFVANLYVFKFDSANAVFKKTYDDDVVYQIYPTASTTYCVVLENNIEFINYKKDTALSNKSEYSVGLVKQLDNKIVAVRSIAANQEESVVEVYNASGKLNHSFNVECNAIDFSYNANKIYLLDSHLISKYNSNGKLISTAKADYDTLFIEFISSNNVACIRNSSIDKIDLNRMEE